MGFTRIHAVGHTTLAKRVTASGVEGAPQPYLWEHWVSEDWEGIQHAAQCLREAIAAGNAAYIPGVLREGLDPKRRHRRTRKGEHATIAERPLSWVAIDIDGATQATADQAIEQLLPAAFHDVSYVLHYTGSHGIKPGLRCRLFFELEHPTPLADLRYLLRSTPKEVDKSIYQAQSLLYVSTPEFTGVADPVTERVVVCEREWECIEAIPAAPPQAEPEHYEASDELDQQEIDMVLAEHRSMAEHGRHHAGLSLACELLGRGMDEGTVREHCTELILSTGRDPQPSEVENFILYHRETQPALRVAPLATLLPDEPQPEVPAPDPIVWDEKATGATANTWLDTYYPRIRPGGPWRLVRLEEQNWAYDPERGWKPVPREWLNAQLVKVNTQLQPEISRKVGIAIRERIFCQAPSDSLTFWLDGTNPEGDFVPVTNGIVHVRKGHASVLMDHDAALFTPARLPFAYDPQAQCPRFEQFIRECWPNDVLAAEEMQKWFGYLLWGTQDLQRFALLVGKARAGKGVLLNVMEQLVGGELTCSPSLPDLGTNFGKQSMIGKRLCTINEIADGSGTNVITGRTLDDIKRITGYDTLQIDRKHVSQVQTKFHGKVAIACNTMPSFNDPSKAIMLRILPFRFAHEVPVERRDDRLLHKLKAELPGILNWAITGYQMLHSEGFKTIASFERERASLQRISDPLAVFLEECITEGADQYATLQDVYAAYQTHCQAHGKMSMAATKMQRSLEDRYAITFYPRTGDAPARFKGIGLTKHGYELSKTVPEKEFSE